MTVLAFIVIAGPLAGTAAAAGGARAGWPGWAGAAGAGLTLAAVVWLLVGAAAPSAGARPWRLPVCGLAQLFLPAHGRGRDAAGRCRVGRLPVGRGGSRAG